MKLILHNNYIERPNDRGLVWLVWDWFNLIDGNPGFACHSLFGPSVGNTGWMDGWLSDEA